MYPSGVWRGFWEQPEYGRQPMDAFELHFADGEVRGHGRDVVGRFTLHGEYDPGTGQIHFVKQYLGRHQVVYRGSPDGEGSILGRWSIDSNWSGPFVLSPLLSRPTGDEPILEIRK